MRLKSGTEFAWVAAATLVGIALSLAYWRAQDGMYQDSYEYMRGAITLWSHQGFKSMSGTPQLVFPPFYPLLLGGLNQGLHNPVLAGRLISLLASSLSIPILFFLVRALSPGFPAVAAAWLWAVSPLRITESSMVLSESVLCALVLLGLALWATSPARPALSFSSGLALGAAYLTRPEGLLVWAVLVVGSLLGTARLRRYPEAASWSAICLLVGGFLVLSLPYVAYLHAHTGHYQLSGKTKMNLAIATAQAAGDEAPWQTLFVLSEDNRELIPPWRAVSPLSIAKHVGRNVRNEAQLLMESAGPFLVACLGLAFAVPWWSRRGAILWPLVAALASPLAAFAPFFVAERMVLPVVPLLILLAVPALAISGEPPPQGRAELRPRAATVLLTCALLWMVSYTGMRVLGARTRSLPAQDPMLSVVFHSRDANGPIIGNNGIELAFATGRDYRRLPWAPLDRVLAYARYHEASFLLATTEDHPAIARLALRPTETADLIPVARSQAGSPYNPVMSELYRLREVGD